MKLFGGGGGGGGGGGFTPGPLLSGVGGNQNDTVAKAPVAGAMIFGNATPLWDRLAIGTTGQALLVAAGLPAWGTLGVAGGGTGFASYTTGDVLYASSSSALSKLAIGTSGQVLTVTGGVPVWATPGAGSGTVTSVAMTVPAALLAVSGSPITGAGTLAVTLATQTANLVFAGPTSGAAATPTFRALIGLDLPPSGTIVNLTDASTIAVDASLWKIAGVVRVTIAADGHTFGAPSTPTDGQKMYLEILSAASHTISWNAAYDGLSIGLPAATTGGGTVDVLLFAYRSTEAKWFLIGASLGGVVPASQGGTGQSSYTVGDTLYASGATTLSKLGIGSTNQALIVAGGVPVWATSPVAGGGTGLTTYTTGDLIYASGATTLSKLGIGTTAQVLTVAGGVPVWATAGTTGGGTGLTSYTTGDILYASASNVLSKLAIGSSGQILTVAAGVPTWAANAAANTALSNLASVAINATLLPGTDAAIDLGSSAKRWVSLNLSSAALVFAAASDANATTNLKGAELQFGAGGASALDVAIKRSAAGILAATNASTGVGTWKLLVTKYVTLTDASPIATDASLGNMFYCLLTAAVGATRQLANPTNPTDGQKITWRLQQSSTGSNAITFGTKFRFGTDITSATLSTANNKIDYLTALYHATDDLWDVVAFVRGY